MVLQHACAQHLAALLNLCYGMNNTKKLSHASSTTYSLDLPISAFGFGCAFQVSVSKLLRSHNASVDPKIILFYDLAYT